MSTIDLAYYFFISGFLTSLIFGVILVAVLSWEARFKELEKYFTKENVNSKHPILKWIIILGNSMVFFGIAIFIWGKINGQY